MYFTDVNLARVCYGATQPLELAHRAVPGRVSYAEAVDGGVFEPCRGVGMTLVRPGGPCLSGAGAGASHN